LAVASDQFAFYWDEAASIELVDVLVDVLLVDHFGAFGFDEEFLSAIIFDILVIVDEEVLLHRLELIKAEVDEP